MAVRNEEANGMAGKGQRPLAAAVRTTIRFVITVDETASVLTRPDDVALSRLWGTASCRQEAPR